MSFDHLTIPELLDELTKYPGYESKSQIKSMIAYRYQLKTADVRKKDILKTIHKVHNKLLKVKKLKTFDYFEALPEELQADILSRDVLKKSPYISKSSNKVTKTNLCQLSITNQEIINYVERESPENIYLFLLKAVNIENKFVVNKFNLNPGKKIQYRCLFEAVKLKYDMITIDYVHLGFFEFKDLISPCEPDLLSSYFIYQNRLSCQHLPNYAKNQIIKILKLKNSPKSSYVDLLSWYMYLRTNLLRFPVQLLKNDYINYEVFLDDKDHILTIEPYMEIETMLNKLKLDTEHLYNQLLYHINQLS